MAPANIPLDPRSRNILGQKFGRLTVIEYEGLKPRDSGSSTNASWWLCLCECGNTKSAPAHNLTKGNTKSCGCLAKDTAVKNGKAATTHNMSRSPEYHCRRSLLGRCYNTNDPSYRHYGERGITVCSRWRESFDNFLEDMGPRPSRKHSIDRIDNNGNYACGKCDECHAAGVFKCNCQWATPVTQGRNRRTNHLVTYKGKTQSLIAWAEELGIPIKTLKDRFRSRTKHRWTVERAFETPVLNRTDVWETADRNDHGQFLKKIT